uniref:Large ribosomal subunit protein uL4c n=1 Tax=Dasya binghamiae TaxID=1896963 RepID=A0A1C8XS34_9FLOR|nr:50S ribosomal protein L4 [Dasya binghamiae]AOH77299.1 50S ribosomal protein L4 [Dasya binghamiae]
MIKKKITYNIQSENYNNNIKNSQDLYLSIHEKTEQQMYIIHRALIQQLNEDRQGNANTKTRSEVRGGGKKPWKQKGTGRARAGSTRSPLWRGGGVIFGPKHKIYKNKINKKEKQLAIKTLIYNKFKNTIVTNNLFDQLNKPNTKLAQKELNNYGFNINNKNILIIIEKSDTLIYLSLRNLCNVELITSNNINVRSLIKADKILITLNALKQINDIYND